MKFKTFLMLSGVLTTLILISIKLVDLRYINTKHTIVHKENVEQTISRIARERGMKPEDIKTFIQIAKCESNLDQYAIGVNKDGSLDKGLFQINGYWHKVPNSCLFNLECNINEAISIANKSGFGAWTCYKKLYATKGN